MISRSLTAAIFCSAVFMTNGCDLATSDLDSLPEAELSVTPETLVYDETDPENNIFTVVSSVPWSAESDNGSIRFQPDEGLEGETTVIVTNVGEGVSGTITFKTVRRSSTDNVKEKTVHVSRKEAGEEIPGNSVLIYYDNLDKTVQSQATYLDQWDGYINATGEGASGVSYTGRSVSIRTSYASMGYEGASGNNAMNFGADNLTMTISGITLKPGQDRLEFSFGATPPSGATFYPGETIKLYVGLDGQSAMANELEFTAVKGSSTWVLATAVFNIEGELPSSLSFTLLSAAKNTKVDDFRLETTDKSGQTITNSSAGAWKCPEIPETVSPDDDYKYVTHYATTYSSGKYVRNYSACYDTRRHNPVWVAYPFHDIYTEGGWTRPSTDPWRPDPEFDESEQSIIYPSDWSSWPSFNDTRRWSKLDGVDDYLGRGHLLASSNRGAGNPDVLLDLNVQTFYPTNISPEYHEYPKHWSLVEGILSNSWNCLDTVYVVAGCYYANDDNVVYDASWSGSIESYAKTCVVPTAHYKVFLRTKSGSTGKRVQDCSASELMAIGFWFEQKLDSSPFETQPALSTVTMSVADIEKRIGNEFKFFPEVPEEVKQTFSISDWPGLQEISNTTYEPGE